MLALVAIIIIAFCNLGLGLVVLLKNRGSATNICFSIFAFMLSAWLIITYYSNDVALNHSLQLWLNRITIFIPGVALFFLLLFSLLFTRKAHKYFRPFAVLFGFTSLIVSFISTTPLVIASIYPKDDFVAIRYGAFTPLFFVFILGEFLAIISILTFSIRRLSGAAKARTQIMAGSIFLALAVTVITNLILPVGFNNYHYVSLGLISTIIIVGGFTYAIIKHRLFDIRSVVARSIAYFLLLVTLGSTYAFLTF
ncbi:MAG: histidine kinase N-terminal 7TM domain-containing protein, partial [Candidatus Saccharimonadales bacterium]